uniref:hypothetical protein n=1 Tax=Prevotella sp. TaxID=59823 RepID=UPI0040293B07
MKSFFSRSAFLAVGLLLPFASHAINVDSLAQVEAKEMGRLPKQATSLQVGLNTSEETSVAYELDYQWYPLNYIGIGIGLELDDDHGNRPLIEAEDDDDYDPDRIVKFNIHPMLSFRTPTLWMNKRHSWGLLLRCDPGLVLSFPRNDKVYYSGYRFEDGNRSVYDRFTLKNRGGRWKFWRVRSAVSVRVDQSLISLGWSVSNYNIAYCRNNMYYQGKRYYGHDSYDKTFSLFASFTFCF